MSDNGLPIADARILGGDNDWYRFEGVTDTNGYVRLPGWAVNWYTNIRALNHYPYVSRVYDGMSIELYRTPIQLQLIGRSAVHAIKFVKDTLIELGYDGDLLTYVYDGFGMTEMARAHLAPRRKHAILRGDTLWYATHDLGVYAYNITDPTSPRLLFHLSTNENLGPIAIMDSLLIVANPWEPSPLQIYQILPNGSWNLLTAWGDLWTQRLEVKNHALFAYTQGDQLISIISLEDAAHPRTMFSWGNPYYAGALRLRDTVVLSPAIGLHPDDFEHLILDISNPSSPTWRSGFRAQRRLWGLVNDTLGVCDYGGQPALLARDSLSGYNVVALGVVTDDPSALDGETPRMIGDFVLFASHLWKIEHK